MSRNRLRRRRTRRRWRPCTVSNKTTGVFSCSVGWMCNQPQLVCPPNITSATNPVESACLFAKQNGFSDGESAAECDDRESYESEFAHGSRARKRELVDHGPGYADGAPVVLRRARQSLPEWWQQRASAAVQPGVNGVYALDPTAAGAFYQNWHQQVPIPVRDLCELEQLVGGHAGERGSGAGSYRAFNVVGGVDWPGHNLTSAEHRGRAGCRPALVPASACPVRQRNRVQRRRLFGSSEPDGRKLEHHALPGRVLRRDQSPKSGDCWTFSPGNYII